MKEMCINLSSNTKAYLTFLNLYEKWMTKTIHSIASKVKHCIIDKRWFQ